MLTVVHEEIEPIYQKKRLFFIEYMEMIGMCIRNTVQILGVSEEDKLVTELGNLYSIETYLEVRTLKERSTEIAFLLMDIQNKDEIAPTLRDAFMASMESDIPVILYNAKKESMAKLCALGIDTECCIVFPYMNEAKIIDILDSRLEARTKESSRTASQKSDGSMNISPPTEISERPSSVELFSEFSSQEKARIIEAKIETGITKDEYELLAKRNASYGDSPGVLPAHQRKTVYARLNRNDYPIHGSAQKLSNNLTFELVLIASYSDPRCKYLRITTLVLCNKSFKFYDLPYIKDHGKKEIVHRPFEGRRTRGIETISSKREVISKKSYSGKDTSIGG